MKLLNDAGLVHQVEIIKGLFHDEAEQRSRQDETLRDKIDNEIQDREASDEELDEKIDQTKQEIEDAIEETLGDYATKQEVSLIPKFAIAVVNELPTEDISPTTVYLLVGGSEQGNLYTEYIYVNNAWETLGSQALDLTGYATKDWVSGVLQGYLSTDGGTMTGSIEWENGDGTFGIRETQADNPNKTTYDIGWNHQNRDGAGLGLRSSDSTLETGQFHLYARDDTQTSTLQGSPDGTLKWNTNIVNQDGTSTTVYRDVVVDVSEGQTNGTISVNGSDVPVHGLGSAAYTDSTEYASSTHTHDYLPLSGGKMTGAIQSNANSNIDATSSTRIEEIVYQGLDKNNKGLGSSFFSAVDTDIFHGFRASNPNFNSGTNWADIRLHVDSNGKYYITSEKHNSLTDGTTDNSNHIPTTAFIHSKYLSLSGGTLTGTLYTSGNIFKSTNTSILSINGGNQYNNAYLNLYGGDHADSPGIFSLAAYDGTNRKQLLGYPDGRLFWAGNTVATTNNTVNLTGDQTVNGTKTFKGHVVSESTTPLKVTTTYDDGSGTTCTSDVIRANTSNSIYGNNIAIGGGGNTIIGGGESYSAQLNALKGNSAENCYVCADENVYIKPNCNTFANAKEFVFKSDGGASFPASIFADGLLIFQQPGVSAKGTNPSAWKEQSVRFADASGQASDAHLLGMVRNEIATDGRVITRMVSYKNASGSSDNESIGVVYPASGDPYTFAPTPATSDNSSKIATTAYVKSNLANYSTTSHTHSYLPLSGGTMTGAITTSAVDFIKRNVNDNHLTILGGTGYNNSASLYLVGGDASSNAGMFQLSAKDGSTNKTLVGKPDGTLTWNGNSIALAKDYLPLSGGTITGSIAKKTNLTKGTKPSSTSWLISNIIYDTAGTATANRMSEYRAFVDANGKTGTEIISYDFTSGATSDAYLGVYKDLNGATHVDTNGQLIINRNNGSAGGGIKLTGAGQNYAMSAQNTNVTKGTAPSSTQYWGIDFYGKDMASYGNRIGILETSLDANNLCSTYIRAYNCTSNTSTANASIGVHVNSSGTAYTSAPTPADSDDSTKIATTAWVRNVAALASHTHNYLPLSGGTLTGNITVKKSDPRILIQDTDFTRGTAPSADVNHVNLYGTDSAGRTAWGIYHKYDKGKSNRVDLIAYKGTTTDNTWAGIGVGYDTNGNWFTYAPTPATGDNSNKMATTSWVRSLFGSSSGIEGISAKGTNYIRYVSGLQICFGAVSSSSFSFPQPFNDVPAISHIATSGDWTRVRNLTKTSAEVSVGNGYYIAVGYWK